MTDQDPELWGRMWAELSKLRDHGGAGWPAGDQVEPVPLAGGRYGVLCLPSRQVWRLDTYVNEAGETEVWALQYLPPGYTVVVHWEHGERVDLAALAIRGGGGPDAPS